MTTVVVGVAAPDVAAAGALADQVVASVLVGRVVAAKAAARAGNVAVPQVLRVEELLAGAVADRSVAAAETPAATAETVSDGPVRGVTSPRVVSADLVHDETNRRVVSVDEARGAMVPMASVRAGMRPVMGVVTDGGVRRGRMAPATGRPIRRSTLR